MLSGTVKGKGSRCGSMSLSMNLSSGSGSCEQGAAGSEIPSLIAIFRAFMSRGFTSPSPKDFLSVRRVPIYGSLWFKFKVVTATLTPDYQITLLV